MKQWYKINNAAEETAEIMIFEQIGKDFWTGDGIDAKSFVNDLKGVKAKKINIDINSPGGSVFDGNAIYNALKAHKAHKHVKISGIAASISSVIAMAGDTIEMPENAMMMIHDPWSFAMGNSDEMMKQAEVLDKIKEGLVSAYVNRTGNDEKTVSKWMTDETWLTAKEAKEHGFCDTIMGKVEAQAGFNLLRQFGNCPEHLTVGAHTDTAHKGDNMDGKKESAGITLELIRNEHPDIVLALVNEGKEAGATLERDRIKAVEDLLISGHEKIIAELKYDGKTTGPEAALILLSAIQADMEVKADTFKADAPDPVAPLPNKEAKQLTGDDKLKAEWEADETLQADFPNVEDYLSYKKPNEGITFKSLTNKERE